MTKVLLRALKSIRPPVGGMFNPPDIFGEEEQIARRLIKEGSAELWDGGKGAGVILNVGRKWAHSRARALGDRRDVGCPWRQAPRCPRGEEGLTMDEGRQTCGS